MGFERHFHIGYRECWSWKLVKDLQNMKQLSVRLKKESLSFRFPVYLAVVKAMMSSVAEK